MSAKYCETYVNLNTAITMEQVKEEEEAAKPLYESDKDDIQVTMDVLEQL